MSKLYIVLCFVLFVQSIRSDESIPERNEAIIKEAGNALLSLDTALITLKKQTDTFEKTEKNAVGTLEEVTSSTRNKFETFIQNFESKIADIATQPMHENCTVPIARFRNYSRSVSAQVKDCFAVELTQSTQDMSRQSEIVYDIIEEMNNIRKEATQWTESMNAQPAQNEECIILAKDRKELITSWLIPKVSAAIENIQSSKVKAKTNIRLCANSRTLKNIEIKYSLTLIQIDICKLEWITGKNANQNNH